MRVFVSAHAPGGAVSGEYNREGRREITEAFQSQSSRGPQTAASVRSERNRFARAPHAQMKMGDKVFQVRLNTELMSSTQSNLLAAAINLFIFKHQIYFFCWNIRIGMCCCC